MEQFVLLVAAPLRVGFGMRSLLAGFVCVLLLVGLAGPPDVVTGLRGCFLAILGTSFSLARRTSNETLVLFSRRNIAWFSMLILWVSCR